VRGANCQFLHSARGFWIGIIFTGFHRLSSFQPHLQSGQPADSKILTLMANRPTGYQTPSTHLKKRWRWG
jgi:hypothetical protein